MSINNFETNHNNIEQPEFELNTAIEQEGTFLVGKIEMKDGDELVARSGFSFNTKTGELIIGPAKYMFRVDPKYSGKGLGVKIGEKTLDFAFQSILKNQIKSIHLTTKRTNTPMMLTATKLGFYIYKEDKNNVYYKLDVENENKKN